MTRIKKQFKKHFWLILISLFFLITRLYKISAIPGSVYWDEASIGYNAYALGIDLKDEWGEFLPLHFRAFGEFKLPVYIYSVAILVKLFGLNSFSVRLPAVIYSLGVVWLTYFLVLKIIKQKTTAFWSAFLMTTSPWFFIFSRTGYEATAGFFFFLLGIYFFLISLEKKNLFLFSILSFIAASYSYNAFRILVPLVFIVLALAYRKEILKNWKIVSLGLVLLGLAIIPILRLYWFDYGGIRLTTVGVKSWAEFFKNYFLHFSPDFLFLKGDPNPRSQVPGQGQLLWVSLPLLVFGLLKILKKSSSEPKLILLLLLLAPIPAAITQEAPHALRSLLLIFPLVVISALGVGQKLGIKLGVGFLTLLLFVNYYWHFLKDYNRLTARDWQIKYQEIFTHLKEQMIVSDKYGQPYIFALFYLKYPPEKFRAEVEYNPPQDWGFSTVKSFGNYEFIKN